MALTVGGGTSPISTKTEVLLDALTATTDWTAEVGGTGAWVDGAVRLDTQAHQGPMGTPWVRVFTGFGTIPSTGVGFRMTKTFSTRDVSLMDNIGVYCGIDGTWDAAANISRFFEINFYLGSDGDGSMDNSVIAKYPVNEFTIGNYAIKFLEVRREDFTTNAGTFDWSDMQDVRIEVLGSNGTLGGPLGTSPPKAYFQGLYLNRRITPTVIVTHDDGGAGIFSDGKSVMDTYGIKTNQMVIPDLVGDSGKMTLAQLQALYAAGHDICLHATFSGDTMSTLANAAITADLIAGLAWMDANGFARAKHCIAWPQADNRNSSNETINDLFVDQGVTVGRGGLVNSNRDTWVATDRYDTDKNNKNLYAASVGVNSTTALPDDVMPPALDHLAKHGGIQYFNFHNVTAGAITAADYAIALSIIKGYVDKGLVQVKTFSQVFDTDGSLLI